MLNQYRDFTKHISFVLIVLLFSVNILSIFPHSALAGNESIDGSNYGTIDNRVINIKYTDCRNNQSQCGNTESMAEDTVGQLGYLAGMAGDVAAISLMGSVSGLSGAGITSGLAAIGSIIGGGMLAGVGVTVVAPVAVSVAAGAAIHYLSQKDSNQEIDIQPEE